MKQPDPAKKKPQTLKVKSRLKVGAPVSYPGGPYGVGTGSVIPNP
jgi:hypothetical protein